MNNQFQGSRNQNLYAKNQISRQEIEEENSTSLIFKPIVKEKIENQIKQQLIQLQISIKDFADKISKFSFQDKMKSLKDKISWLEFFIENDKSLDLEQLQTYVKYLKDNYISPEKNFIKQVNVFSDASYFNSENLYKFLTKIQQYQSGYQECQTLLFLDQELTNLEILQSILNPTVKNYKEILYYEKVDSPIKQYMKNKKTYSKPFSQWQINILFGLLNKYYKFGAWPKQQEKYVDYVKLTPDFNLNQSQYQEKLIIMLEIPLDQTNTTYALLNINHQQNLKVCKSTSIPKQRNQLQQLSQQLGCNQFTATLVTECSQDYALTEFLKIVAPQLDIQQLIQFLEENDYFIKEDKQEQGRQDINYFVDMFEMEKLGFSLA